VHTFRHSPGATRARVFCKNRSCPLYRVKRAPGKTGCARTRGSSVWADGWGENTSVGQQQRPTCDSAHLPIVYGGLPGGGYAGPTGNARRALASAAHRKVSIRRAAGRVRGEPRPPPSRARRGGRTWAAHGLPRRPNARAQFSKRLLCATWTNPASVDFPFLIDPAPDPPTRFSLPPRARHLGVLAWSGIVGATQAVGAHARERHSLEDMSRHTS